MENTPQLWKELLPRRQGNVHKYDLGHAVVYGAPELTGATRLAAEACARVGAGLTTVLCDPDIADVYRASLPAHIMVRDDVMWNDSRITAKLYGPGGVAVKPEFQSDVPTVLDADGLWDLPSSLSPNFVLTPHEGEFSRVFPDLSGNKEARALAAAKACGATVLLKGAETVIANSDGRCVINTHASPYLATAGSGDALAGMITGLLAQGMPVFEAACAAVWIHGECALRFGVGLVATDIPEIIPDILQDLT